MNKIAAVKLVTRIVVGAGTTTVTKSIIDNNVEIDNKFKLVSVGLASLVIGSMASEATKSHTDAKIDALVEAWNDARSSDDTTVTA